ncbi:MBL fold metallo-hydrolase [Streptomyces sp. NBC_00239]|uniref:MBL fold metallo-hydrolase n=1 Tax=Streptomyces sp. NBC_00239 TaxID=2903640 RepID=UPI002E2CA1DF|nr:MBL fold metallo-hydrolase [Streptomyces sp. NBC_00239]
MTLPKELTRIAAGLHAWTPQISGTWGFANCLLVSSGHDAALIDTPYDEPMTRALISAAAPLLADGTRVSTIVNTHSNGDHTFGNRFFPGADIITTQSSADHLCNEPTPEQMHHLTTETAADQPLGWYMRRHFGRFEYDGDELLPPTRTFTGRHRFNVGMTEVELIEVGPAHTAGDLIVHFPEQRTVCTGDVVFLDDHPVHWQGPLAGVSKACETILSLDPETILPGHGPVVGPSEVRAYLDYLQELEGRIHAGHRAGRSAEATAAEILSSGFHGHLGLPERIIILTAVEYRHLNDDPTDPDLIALADQAARWAFEHNRDAPVPAPRQGAVLHP